MYVNTTSIQVKDKALAFHVAAGPFSVDTSNKTILGALASFNDNTIQNNVSNGAVRPGKVSQFTIKGTDVVITNNIIDVDASVKQYLDANIATIVAAN